MRDSQRLLRTIRRKRRRTVGATCGRPSIHSKLKTGEHSSPYDVMCNTILITADTRYIFVNSLGGSKPPPYRVEYKFTFTDNRNISCSNLLLYKILQNNLIDTIKANS